MYNMDKDVAGTIWHYSTVNMKFSEGKACILFQAEAELIIYRLPFGTVLTE